MSMATDRSLRPEAPRAAPSRSGPRRGTETPGPQSPSPSPSPSPRQRKTRPTTGRARKRTGAAQTLTGCGVPSVTRGSISRRTFRSTKNAAVGIVPATSTHSSLPNFHFALEPRSKAKTR